MSEQSTSAEHLPKPEQVIMPASENVKFDGLHQDLLTYVVSLGYIHYLLFGLPALVCQAAGPGPCIHAFHQLGRAVDIELKDRNEGEANLFLAIITYSAPHQACVFADERIRPGVKYVHVEYRGI